MLEPVRYVTSAPDAAGAPDMLDALKILSRKRSEHTLENSRL